jgi:hypothetical protein
MDISSPSLRPSAIEPVLLEPFLVDLNAELCGLRHERPATASSAAESIDVSSLASSAESVPNRIL